MPAHRALKKKIPGRHPGIFAVSTLPLNASGWVPGMRVRTSSSRPRPPADPAPALRAAGGSSAVKAAGTSLPADRPMPEADTSALPAAGSSLPAADSPLTTGPRPAGLPWASPQGRRQAWRRRHRSQMGPSHPRAGPRQPGAALHRRRPRPGGRTCHRIHHRSRDADRPGSWGSASALRASGPRVWRPASAWSAGPWSSAAWSAQPRQVPARASARLAEGRPAAASSVRAWLQVPGPREAAWQQALPVLARASEPVAADTRVRAQQEQPPAPGADTQERVPEADTLVLVPELVPVLAQASGPAAADRPVADTQVADKPEEALPPVRVPGPLPRPGLRPRPELPRSFSRHLQGGRRLAEAGQPRRNPRAGRTLRSGPWPQRRCRPPSQPQPRRPSGSRHVSWFPPGK